MYRYRIAGQEFYFSGPFPEIEFFKVAGTKPGEADEASPFVFSSFPGTEYPGLASRTAGWVAGAQRPVEVYEGSSGFLLKIAGCGEFIIPPYGETINKKDAQGGLSQLDREVILGPALVLALALRGVWSLHASAAMYKGNVIAFLGESGQGKSTLVKYLSESPGWTLIADDMLPVVLNGNDVTALPCFPQLKLPVHAQPAAGLPEQLPLKYICVLSRADPDQTPVLTGISTSSTVHALLSHIAGTRMFNKDLLTKHLKFSSRAAPSLTAYRLVNPHRRDTLPLVKGYLEEIG